MVSVQKQINHRPRLLYDRGDYQRLKQELNIDWGGEFGQCDGNVEKLWHVFKDKIQRAVEISVPSANSKWEKKEIKLDTTG